MDGTPLDGAEVPMTAWDADGDESPVSKHIHSFQTFPCRNIAPTKFIHLRPPAAATSPVAVHHRRPTIPTTYTRRSRRSCARSAAIASTSSSPTSCSPSSMCPISAWMRPARRARKYRRPDSGSERRPGAIRRSVTCSRWPLALVRRSCPARCRWTTAMRDRRDV